MRVIVTDLTRFANEDIVCIAGICPKTRTCVRPLPYLKRSKCEELSILPGAILDGEFTSQEALPPHVEDASYSNLRFCGPCSCAEFHRVLVEGSAPSVEKGFSVAIPPGQKYIPREIPPATSIISIPIDPSGLQIVRDAYNLTKIKVHVRDRSGREFRYMPITDLGFYEYAIRSAGDGTSLQKLNDFICRQESVVLRVGLSREYKAVDGRQGFWLQANGIYTFPDYLEEIRCYRRD
jgi:hypothetical protein